MTARRSMHLLILTFAAAVAGCESVSGPIQGDDPSAILGQYSIGTVNSIATFPVTLATSDTLTLKLGDATLALYADGTYIYSQYTYEIRPAGTDGLPRPGTGRFALHGTLLEFVASSGVAPEAAALISSQIRLVQSIRSGRKADTLIFNRR